MSAVINQVFKYVNHHRGYRASLGVITNTGERESILAWGAVEEETGKAWVPDLNNVRLSWPDAEWTPMSTQQASLFERAYERERETRQDWLMSL